MKVFNNKLSALVILIGLSIFSGRLIAQEKLSTEGTVYDVLGNPVAGVKITSIRGTNIAYTDTLGIFKLNTPSQDDVILAKEGYLSRQVRLRPGDANSFLLDSDILDQLQSVGYGFQKRRHVLGAVSSIEGDALSKYSTTRTSQALYGLIPGLIIQDKAEYINDDAPNFFIRGKSTFGNASNIPMVIVDGFIRSMDDIAIEDIASVNVLKDAAATAIYGMRGANGVIVVETKRGSVGPMHYKVNIEQGFRTPIRIPKFTSSAQYAGYYNQALANDGLPAYYSAAQIAGFEQGNSTLYPDNQWQDELTKDMTPTTRVNATASGGNKIAKYYVSLGFRRDNGLFDNTNKFSEDYSTNPSNNKYNFRTNLDVTAIDNLDLKLDISGQVNDRNLSRNDEPSIWNHLYRYPQSEFPMMLPDGSLGGNAIFSENPYGYLNQSGYRRILHRFVQSALTAEYHLQGGLEGASFGGSYAYDNVWNTNEDFTRSYSVKEIIPDGSGSYTTQTIGKETSLSYGTGNWQQRRETIEGFIKYKKEFADIHSLNATFVYHQDRLTSDQNNPYNNQYWGGRINYGYDAKYLAELTFSYSGSEAFAKKNRYEFYPAAALGWIVSNEEFLKENNTVNFLKVRTSAGLSGNSELNERFSYRQLTTYYGDNYRFGTNANGYAGRTIGTLANPNLKAEKAFKFDFGVESQLFNSLYVNANYFFERRFDVLTNWDNIYSSITGISYPNVNYGVAFNYGLELQLNYEKQIDKDWSLSGNLNFLTYKNEIRKVLENPLPSNSLYQSKLGSIIGDELGLVAIGLFESEADIASSPTQEFGTVNVGDIKYKDVNNDGVINDYDRVWMGSYPIPNTEVGLTLGAKYKHFDVSALFHAQFGSDIYLGDASNIFWAFNGNNYRVSEWISDRIESGNYPRLSTGKNSNNYRRSTYWMENGDCLRLRYIELGYTLPTNIASKMYMTNCRLFLRGTNIFSLDHLKVLDPGALTGAPMMRSYFVGCSLSF